MPTVILLDLSLSMTRPIVSGDNDFQRKHLAIQGVSTLLDYLAAHNRLEFTALVAFSSLWELVVPFTRDYKELKEGLNRMDDYDKTCIETGLAGVSQIVMDEWGVGLPCQVVLVTDGSPGVGKGSLKESLERFYSSQQHHDDLPTEGEEFPLPFPFPSKLHLVCLATPPEVQGVLGQLQRLVDINGGAGGVYLPEGELNMTTCQALFSKLAETQFPSVTWTLKCGHMSSEVQAVPVVETFKKTYDSGPVVREPSQEMEILGFLDSKDIASPAVISRHLVLPKPTKTEKDVSEGGGGASAEGDGDTAEHDGKAPSFCVLLHGSLKVESMVALVQLGESWYGFLYSWADSKKKSNLMLSVLEPGEDAVSWLGKISQLGPVASSPHNPYGEDDTTSPYPVRHADKRSYAQNTTVWIKPSGLQTDVQKILRNARKLPDKQQTFYKELNRLRKAALSFGFVDLLEGMSAMLERECTLLPGTAHPDAALQLTHAAKELRLAINKDYDDNIAPLQTHFSKSDND
ncbi:PREDICTED: von Willebrand factor A domain-containing protein 9-like [Branchiostoma belcheri]|uniref:Integrator complex subunit 14 n=1 Tax=Branchiostoma belcheri TaxID=7741 RepID=A0A6P4YE61_BRABE|nr:PREDICTED: von Willebrand factor A domain-containing protein 9-like [Branchiostoma belcheri]XP_019615222.1 PREDICTED: von Willebrand factor A domain-containing protein 9-like [Branchiostoma belcheri]XP_019615224.1 PREDICTED: von Willebrand factor A domain-containing protein 9-like [Branchiostoma belcheri]XP_019615225.1 PREDICTED: von Willebrand factor A domain-containing protein 9-like [Branchiostoma belcheri]KAI8478996.1 von Willebrand factor type A domain [Branchiostoma belcheri]